jgi:hypothetical protein
MEEWKPSNNIDANNWTDVGDIDWDTVDINNPDFDDIRRQLASSISVFKMILARMNTGQSALPTDEMEIKKIMVQTALVETQIYAELVDKVLAMRHLISGR